MSVSPLSGRGRRPGALLLLPAALVVATAAMAAVSAWKDPATQPSEPMPRAAQSLLLDLVATPAGYFAVGERGHVLRSDDGATWTQLQTPTRSTLTTVASAEGHLWAAGHDGVILHSGDAGKTWTAQRRDPFDASMDPMRRGPRQGVPILDILFRDARNGIAVGAYSLMLVTADGGATWTEKTPVAPSDEPDEPAAPMEGDIFSAEDLELGEESNPHLNAIVAAGGDTLVVVGERGTLLRSDDAGESWRRMAFPYKGSMFGVLALGNGRLMAFGLRGNVYESTSLGARWSKVPAQGSASWMGGAPMANGGAVLVGANGTVLSRDSANAEFAPATFRNAAGETPMLSGVSPDGKGNYVLVGDKGADLFRAN